MCTTYEANLNCDGKDCKTRPVTSLNYVTAQQARNKVWMKAKNQDWVFIEDEHYCQDCAEKVTK